MRSINAPSAGHQFAFEPADGHDQTAEQFEQRERQARRNGALKRS